MKVLETDGDDLELTRLALSAGKLQSATKVSILSMLQTKGASKEIEKCSGGPPVETDSKPLKCLICGKYAALDHSQEHSDFHFAIQLQRSQGKINKNRKRKPSTDIRNFFNVPSNRKQKLQ